MRLLPLAAALALLVATGPASAAEPAPASAVAVAGARPPILRGVGSGTHYWIDPARGDDEALGTKSLPWKSVDRVERAELLPGDLVHVLAGTYDLDTNLRLDGLIGTADAWIGLRAEGHVTLRNRATENVVDVVGARYLFLEGFEITHDNGDASYESWEPIDGIKFRDRDSAHVAILDCHLHGLGGVGIASQVPEIRSVTVWGCEIDTCASGIYWGYYEADERHVAHDSRIARNRIHHCPPIDVDGTGYGIQIKGGSTGNVIEENVLEDVGGGDRAGIAVYHVSTSDGPCAARNVIRRNLVRRARNQGIYAAEGALIENNLVLDSGECGIEIGPRDAGPRGRFHGNMTVRNNTVIGVTAPEGRGIRLQDGAFAKPYVVRNNVAIVWESGQIALRGPASFAGHAAANHCFGGTSGRGLGIVTLDDPYCFGSLEWGDPEFGVPVDSAPIVDACDARGAPLEDLTGALRSAPDAGAIEASAESLPYWFRR